MNEKQPKAKHPYACPCGFHGGSRGIREHRMKCASWLETIRNKSNDKFPIKALPND